MFMSKSPAPAPNMQTAKLFMNGRSQAVRLPAAFRFEGGEVRIRRDPESGEVILSPLNRSFEVWVALRDRLLSQIPSEDLDALDVSRGDIRRGA
jgi:antitoxin VapB